MRVPVPGSMWVRPGASSLIAGVGYTRVHECAAPLESPVFSKQGVLMGAVLSRKVVTTEASLSGWGGLHDGLADSRVCRGAGGLQEGRSAVRLLGRSSQG